MEIEIKSIFNGQKSRIREEVEKMINSFGVNILKRDIKTSGRRNSGLIKIEIDVAGQISHKDIFKKFNHSAAKCFKRK